MMDTLYSFSEKEPAISHFLVINLDGKKFYSLETVEMYRAAKQMYIDQGYFWSYTNLQDGEDWGVS